MPPAEHEQTIPASDIEEANLIRPSFTIFKLLPLGSDGSTGHDRLLVILDKLSVSAEQARAGEVDLWSGTPETECGVRLPLQSIHSDHFALVCRIGLKFSEQSFLTCWLGGSLIRRRVRNSSNILVVLLSLDLSRCPSSQTIKSIGGWHDASVLLKA